MGYAERNLKFNDTDHASSSDREHLTLPSDMAGGASITELIACNIRVERARRRWNQQELGDMIGYISLRDQRN
jgi:hypothetical protein